MIEDNNMKKAFGKNLSDILYERKISQKQLGEHMKVGSSPTTGRIRTTRIFTENQVFMRVFPCPDVVNVC